MSELFPAGIDNITDLPHGLWRAIRKALQVLAWHENAMDEKDIPPRAIWHDEDELGEFFKRRKQQRKRETDPDGPGEIDDPVENAAASGLIVG